MDFIQIQIMIFATIIISSLFGKKALIISTLVWAIETMLVYRTSHINYLQVITVALSFQISLFIAIVRDYIVKKIKKNTNKVQS